MFNRSGCNGIRGAVTWDSSRDCRLAIASAASAAPWFAGRRAAGLRVNFARPLHPGAYYLVALNLPGCSGIEGGMGDIS